MFVLHLLSMEFLFAQFIRVHPNFQWLILYNGKSNSVDDNSRNAELFVLIVRLTFTINQHRRVSLHDMLVRVPKIRH